jgi:hypothetical protein
MGPLRAKARARDHEVAVVSAVMSLWSKLRRLFSPGAPPGEVTSQQLFTAEVVAAARGLLVKATVVEQPAEFALLIQTRTGPENKVFLTNLFAETRDLAPADRAARIQRFLRPLEQPPVDRADWASVREHLVPLLRTSTHALGSPDVAATLLRRPVWPFLIECVGVDAEDSFQLVASAQLTTWNQTAEAVFTAARENAARHFGQGDSKIYDDRLPYPLWHVSRDDSYESSRLLLPGWLASFTGKVKGRPVAIVPHRSFVLVGGDGDEACLQRLIESARREYEASTRAVSPALYTVDDAGAVVPLTLASDHPLASQVAIGHVLLASHEYGAHREVLQRRHGEAVFVSSYVGIQRKDGSVSSYTTWTKDVPSLLPRAHEIAFVIDPGQLSSRMYRVSWERALARLGEALVPVPDVDPPHWSTSGWPDEKLLAELEAEERG